MKQPPALFIALLLAANPISPAWGHGGEDHGHDDAPVPVVVTKPGVAVAAPRRQSDGSLLVAAATQQQLGLRTQTAVLAEHATSREFNGRVVADPNASGLVQAIQPGRVEPGAKGLPLLGKKVVKGQVLAWLRPAANTLERANQQGLLADLEAQIAIAERKVARYEQLQGSVPQSALDSARIEVTALKKRHVAAQGSVGVVEALVAPVSGVISATHVVAGQVVDAREILFEIINPARMAVEALAYDADAANDIAAATAITPRGALELRFAGTGRQLREQAIPLLFHIRNDSPPVYVGQAVKVVARTASTMSGVALPKAAVLKDATGNAYVWVQTQPERFVRRPVETEPISAFTVVVGEGLQAGERVVINGANLLAQVR